MTEERSVLIAGCSDGGIGLALALAFVRRGFHVFVTARTIANMSKLHNLENVTLLSLDVVDSAQIKATVAAVSKQTGGKLDYLISNAGQNRFMPLLDERIEDAKSLYDINFWGPLQLVQAFSPLLIKSKGTIVFVASVSGYLNVPWQGVYAASKRGVEILADVFRLELAPFDVKTISIVTGAVKTNSHTRYESWSFPETSLYTSIQPNFIKRASGNDGAPRMDAHQYAEGVVAKILNGNHSKFWYGASAMVVKFATSWVPTSWMDIGLAKGTGIDIMLQQKQ